jgi:hypothetical protein
MENGILRGVLDRSKWTNDAGGRRNLVKSARIDQNEKKTINFPFSLLPSP